MGLFWKKTNPTGAFVGLISGFVLGILKLLIEAIVSFNDIQFGLLRNIADFNFLYYSGILFLISVIIMIITSRSRNNLFDIVMKTIPDIVVHTIVFESLFWGIPKGILFTPK